MLIGSELKDLKNTSHSNIFLIGAGELCSYYEKALQILEPGKKVKIINADEATIKGQYKTFNLILGPSPAKPEKEARQ